MENVKIPFFKRVKRAIVNFEKYADFALEKTETAIKYYAKLILIFSIIISIAFTYKFSTIMNNEEELQILQNQLTETGTDAQVIEQSINFMKDNTNTQFYATLALSMTFYLFCSYFILTFINILFTSILGIIVTRISKMKIKYKSILSMSIYAFTLSIILNCIYSVANILTGFTIGYFQIVYNVIACIYIITAILMIKTDFIEQQKELIKIVKEQAKIKRETKQKDEDEEKLNPPEDSKKEETPSNEEPTSESEA